MTFLLFAVAMLAAVILAACLPNSRKRKIARTSAFAAAMLVFAALTVPAHACPPVGVPAQAAVGSYGNVGVPLAYGTTAVIAAPVAVVAAPVVTSHVLTTSAYATQAVVAAPVVVNHHVNVRHHANTRSRGGIFGRRGSSSTTVVRQRIR